MSQDDLQCRKMNRPVSREKPVCLDPDNPCKFRSECLVYLLWKTLLEEEAGKRDPD